MTAASGVTAFKKRIFELYREPWWLTAKGQKTLHANNYREAADALLNRIQPGDALLVKASRGMALEKALEIFYAEQKDTRE